MKNDLRNKGLSLIVAASLGMGCNSKTRMQEYSPTLHEDATVSETVYSPSRHGDGLGVGIGTNSSDGMPVTTITPVSINIPKKYAVVFKCQHGKFIVEGTGKRHKDLWERLNEGEQVDIAYREVYMSTYQDTNDDGVKDLIEKALIGYDFLDAQPNEKQK